MKVTIEMINLFLSQNFPRGHYLSSPCFQQIPDREREHLRVAPFIFSARVESGHRTYPHST
jgi:hypothetical protein